MESLLWIFRMHWDHEPGRRNGVRRHVAAFLDATRRVETKRRHVRALPKNCGWTSGSWRASFRSFACIGTMNRAAGTERGSVSRSTSPCKPSCCGSQTRAPKPGSWRASPKNSRIESLNPMELLARLLPHPGAQAGRRGGVKSTCVIALNSVLFQRLGGEFMHVYLCSFCSFCSLALYLSVSIRVRAGRATDHGLRDHGLREPEFNHRERKGRKEEKESLPCFVVCFEVGSFVFPNSLCSLRSLRLNQLTLPRLGGAFCNRQQELADLLRAMENAEKLFVFT